MIDAWRSFKVREFEHVIAGPSTSLLRVSGKAPRRGAGPQRPTLAADDGQQVRRFAAIPAPPDPRGVLRAAYSVATEVMTPSTVFSLELGDGSVIALPAPTPGAGRFQSGSAGTAGTADSADAAPDGADPGSPADAPAESDPERRSETIDKLAELSAALAQAEQATAEAQERARAEIAQAGERAEAAAAEADRRAQAAVAEADRRAQAAVGEGREQAQARAVEAEQRASARVAEATSQADARVAAAEAAIESRIAEANERADVATQDAAAAHELSESLERRNVQLDKSVRELQERIQSLERELASVAEARADFEREIAALRRARANSEQELEQARDAARVMTFERDELSRQVVAFDGVAVKARDRATQAESAQQRAEAALHELQTWRGELERRLTATTTELGVAKTARQDDEHELKRVRGELAEAEAKFEIARAEIEILNAKLASGATPEPAPDGAPTATTESAALATDQSAELERMAAELGALRAAQATGGEQADSETLERLQMLEAERDEIARRAEQLAALLKPAERLAELAQDLSRAQAEAESLQAAVAVELPRSGNAPRPASATRPEGDTANGALAGARAEIDALRGQLEQARADAAEAQVELIGHEAEAEARQQAQRELAEAARQTGSSGR